MVGATYLMEVGFVFDNVLGTGMDSSSFAVPDAARNEKYVALGQLMSRMWISFVVSHDPNNHGVESFTTEWPEYNTSTPVNMVFDGNTTSFVETDLWRVDAMQIFIDHALDFSR